MLNATGLAPAETAPAAAGHLSSRQSGLWQSKAARSSGKIGLAGCLLVWALLLFLAGCGDTITNNTTGGGDGSPTPPTQQPLCAGPDTDGDGLPDCQETMGWQVALLDYEGLGDLVTYTATSNPAVADTDGDGLDDYQEFLHRTDGRVSDTDGDGLTDYDEVFTYTSNPVSVDSDGDTLRDGQEVNQYGTSPTLADTDGDGATDSEEVLSSGFNPLIAELPKLEISITTAPFLTMDGEITAGTAATTYAATLQSRSDSSSRSATASTETTESNSQEISTEVSATYFPPGLSGSVSASANWSEATTNTSSSAWSADSTTAAQQEYQNSVNNEATETFTNGIINVGFSIRNTGERAVKVDNLKIAVLKRNVFNYSAQPQLVTELVPKDGGQTSFQIANGASKGPLLATDDSISPFAMRRLLADPRGLEFVVSSFDFTDIDCTAADCAINYNKIAQDTVARTALVMIDYGDGRVDKRMVATGTRRDAQGNPTGITLAEALRIMGVSYTVQAQDRDLDGDGLPDVTRNVLTRIGNVSVDPSSFMMWMVASSSPDAVNASVSFENITLRSRDVVQLIYVRDTDGDGLIDRRELLYGTDIHVKDTDGDGASDGEEVAAGTDPLGVVSNANALVLTGDTSTLVGNGTATSTSGVGVAATTNAPYQVVYARNALYFTEEATNLIRKVDLATKQVTSIAGSEVAGFVDGNGLSARFNLPAGLAVDADGNFLYVADRLNDAVRKIDLTTLSVTTLAGSGLVGPPASGCVDGAADVARFSVPEGLTVAGRYLYVADTLSSVVRRVDTGTGQTSTVAGRCATQDHIDGIGPNARLILPRGMVNDGVHIYFSDQCAIRKLRIANGEVTTLAGSTCVGGAPVDGVGTAAVFTDHIAIVSDRTYLYAADRGSNTLRRVHTVTGQTDTIAGELGGPLGFADGTAALFHFPTGVATDGVFLYVADSGNHRIRRIQ